MAGVHLVKDALGGHPLQRQSGLPQQSRGEGEQRRGRELVDKRRKEREKERRTDERREGRGGAEKSTSDEKRPGRKEEDRLMHYIVCNCQVCVISRSLR